MPTKAPRRETRWKRVEPQVLQRVIFETEEVRFALYKVAAGFHNTLHAHDYAQMGVVISGRGTHRTAVALTRGGRLQSEVQEFNVRDGDCFYVPPGAPHELEVEPTGPMVLLEVTLPLSRGRDAPPGPGAGRPEGVLGMAPRRRATVVSAGRARSSGAGRGRGWTRVDRFTQRKIVADTEEAEFALVRVGVGHSFEMHAHREGQVGVIISGSGVHRMLLSVRRGRRTVRQFTDIHLRAGDCYFIPAGVPHEFHVEGNRPVVALDVTLARPRRRRAAARKRSSS